MEKNLEDLWCEYDINIRRLRIQADGYRWLFERSMDKFTTYDTFIHLFALAFGFVMGGVSYFVAFRESTWLRGLMSLLTTFSGFVSAVIRYLNYPKRIAQLSACQLNMCNLINDIDRQLAMPASRREDPAHFMQLILANFRQITDNREQFDIPKSVMVAFLRAHSKLPLDEIPDIIGRLVDPSLLENRPNTAENTRDVIRRSDTNTSSQNLSPIPENTTNNFRRPSLKSNRITQQTINIELQKMRMGSELNRSTA